MCLDHRIVHRDPRMCGSQIKQKNQSPIHRNVQLQSDPHLAQLLREAANVRLAVSVPVLVAPAFVAGLFGDRVLSVFVLQERLMAVLDLVIQVQDRHLVGQSARTVMRSGRGSRAARASAWQVCRAALDAINATEHARGYSKRTSRENSKANL